MSNARHAVNKRQDRTNFCARCGVTFLWTAEEQVTVERRTPPNEQPRAGQEPADENGHKDIDGIDGHAPTEETEQTASTQGSAMSRPIRPKYCPGCRQLLPPEGRERGLVKWYNRRKRFGFITRKDQPDLFVHGSALQARKPLYPDMLVEFSIRETDRGLAADRVQILEIPEPGTHDADTDNTG